MTTARLRPRIGITTRHLPADHNGLGSARADGWWLHGALLRRCAQIEALAWPLALEMAGTNEDVSTTAAAVIAELDGLILGGGSDIGADPARDAFELALLAHARARGVPVLGICRGAQLIHCAFGGELLPPLTPPDQPDLHCDRTRHVGLHHALAVQGGGLLASVVGAGNHVVNSAHRWRIERLAPGLRVEALCPDDASIEAFSGEGEHWLLGVQWHPEFESDVASALPGTAIFGLLLGALVRRELSAARTD